VDSGPETRSHRLANECIYSNGMTVPSTPRNMALTPGTRLGVYEVTAKIGEGGMGERCRLKADGRTHDGTAQAV